MPDLPRYPAATHFPVAVSQPVPLMKAAKTQIEQGTELLNSLTTFANSEAGKAIISFLRPNQAPIVSQAGGGKPDTHSANAPLPHNIPRSEPAMPPQPRELLPSEMIDLFISGMMKTSETIGEEKTLKEAIAWVTENKGVLVMAIKANKNFLNPQ